MHDDFEINLKNISKIEGHTHLDLKVRKRKVEYCKLKISQNKRFFTDAIIGKKFNEAPALLSRICGTCSSAHVLASIETIEKAFGINVTKQTKILRNLLINANHLRDHAMHLYFFCLPDVFRKDSVLEFEGDLHKWIHYGMDVKDAGNFLSVIVGGRAIHPPNAVVGGFTKFPRKEEKKNAKKKLTDSRDKIIELINLLYEKRKPFVRDTNYVGLINSDYNFLEGEIKTSFGSRIKEKDFREHLEKVILPYSTAEAFKFESKEFFVGALARLNVNKKSLNKKTKKSLGKILNLFPSDSILDNNLAQAIEMLHIVDNSLELLKNEFKKEKLVKIIPKESVGVGVVEAPRGTLYHKLEFDKNGIIKNIDLCIPTSQNIIHLENSISKFVEKNINLSKKGLLRKIEEMIRVYDPCMSCATHFLRINWL